MIATEETLRSKGGIDIFLRSWRTQGTPRGTVVMCHGLNAHGGLYAWAGEQFASAGLVAYALDLRGRGKSAGERFFVEDLADYAADVALAVGTAKQRDPGLPVFLLGHSAGGVTACIYALDHQAEIDGLICESFAFRVPAPGFALSAIKWLSGFLPRLKVLTLDNRHFSRDPAVVAALNADPLIAGEAQPARTVAALVRAAERLETGFGKITLPVLILHGTADKVTLPSGSQFFHDRSGSKDKTLKLYDGHYHDLLADLGRSEVIADIQGWIEARLPNAMMKAS